MSHASSLWGYLMRDDFDQPLPCHQISDNESDNSNSNKINKHARWCIERCCTRSQPCAKQHPIQVQSHKALRPSNTMHWMSSLWRDIMGLWHILFSAGLLIWAAEKRHRHFYDFLAEGRRFKLLARTVTCGLRAYHCPCHWDCLWDCPLLLLCNISALTTEWRVSCQLNWELHVLWVVHWQLNWVGSLLCFCIDNLIGSHLCFCIDSWIGSFLPEVRTLSTWPSSRPRSNQKIFHDK